MPDRFVPMQMAVSAYQQRVAGMGVVAVVVAVRVLVMVVDVDPIIIL